jgi:hypothetical protein
MAIDFGVIAPDFYGDTREKVSLKFQFINGSVPPAVAGGSCVDNKFGH